MDREFFLDLGDLMGEGICIGVEMGLDGRGQNQMTQEESELMEELIRAFLAKWFFKAKVEIDG